MATGEKSAFAMSDGPKSQMRYFLIFIILNGLLMSAGSQERPQHHERCLGSGHDLGEAVDINAFYDKPVKLYGKDPEASKMVDNTQDIFNHAKDRGPPPLENYRPAGLYRNGKLFNDRKLKENHKDHIHVRFSSPASQIESSDHFDTSRVFQSPIPLSWEPGTDGKFPPFRENVHRESMLFFELQLLTYPSSLSLFKLTQSRQAT